ncbi:MAG: ATPase [Bacteroidales bacterium]|nr:ATPase [Bacteroidales bacterium]
MNKKIAIPVKEGKLSAHFGECTSFMIYETDQTSIIGFGEFQPPLKSRGVFPSFLINKGVNAVIAGGLGIKAMRLFEANEVEVISGVNNTDPIGLVEMYLKNELHSGMNLCDH